MTIRNFFFWLCFLLISSNFYGQVSADCRYAVPICADVPTMGLADGAGDVDDFDPDVIRESGCLEKGSIGSANIEHNTAWYVFRAGTDGIIGFNIEALSVTADWDYALYGPEVSCGNFGEPIRCNYETDGTAFTGVGEHPAPGVVGPEDENYAYDDWLEVKAGETYYLLINNFNTNFDGDAEPFSLTFTGSSVDADQENALDCTIKNEFLGQDVKACVGADPVVLSAVNSGAGTAAINYDWFWDNGDGSGPQLVSSGAAEETYEVSSPNSGTYSVVVTTASATFQDNDPGIVVTFYGTPVVDDIIVDDILDNNKITIVMVGDGDFEYSLNGSDFQESPDFMNVPPGLNEITVNDTNGCGTVSEDVLVVGYPKFFTPNGDNTHDLWHVVGIETLITGKVYVFDRYGKLLKQLSQGSAGWNGTFNGKPLPSTDYWFRFEYSRVEEGIIVATTVRKHFTLKR